MIDVYVKLQKLEELVYEGWTQEERAAWLRNLDANDVREDGYTFAYDDGDDFKREELDSNLLKEVDSDDEAVLYNFMGSKHESERFYVSEHTVYKHSETGAYYVLDNGELDVF